MEASDRGRHLVGGAGTALTRRAPTWARMAAALTSGTIYHSSNCTHKDEDQTMTTNNTSSITEGADVVGSAFEGLEQLFLNAHGAAAAGNPAPFAALFTAPLITGVAVVDLAELCPSDATRFDAAVVDELSYVARHDLVRALEDVADHLGSAPSAIRAKLGSEMIGFASRTDAVIGFEDAAVAPAGLRYALLALSGDAGALLVAIADISGAVVSIMRAPAGLGRGLHEGVARVVDRALSAVFADFVL